MRDILVFLTVFGTLPFILQRPYIGVLVWSWLGYMNPHRLTWGPAYDFPFAQVVGAVTLLALFISREKKHFPVTGLTVVWVLFVVWMNVSTIFSIYPESAWNEWDRTMKIQLFTIVTVLLMRDHVRINYLVIVIAVCIGFFGVKGGIFSVLTGGGNLVWGPPGSFIEGNNAMGLAMVMVLPLIWYLYLQARRRSVRYLLLGAAGLTALSILTTHSRGAFLAIIAMAFYLWLKSRHKGRLALMLLAAAPVLWFSMPQEWHDRMETIRTYEEDGSAMGRINAWYFAVNLANERPMVGGGFQVFTPEQFRKHAPDPDDFHDAHSIYFEVLAEHGYPGLLLFLATGLLAMRTARRVAREAQAKDREQWIVDLASMLQASIVGYAVGGMFLGLAYFDLFYHIVALVILLSSLVRESGETAPADSRRQREAAGSGATPANGRSSGATA